MTKKKLEIVIVKQTVSEGFYIMLRGFMPDPEVKGCISRRLPDYETAYWMAKTIATTLRLVGHESKCFNDRWAENDSNTYCGDDMDFERFETLKEN